MQSFLGICLVRPLGSGHTPSPRNTSYAQPRVHSRHPHGEPSHPFRVASPRAERAARDAVGPPDARVGALLRSTRTDNELRFVRRLNLACSPQRARALRIQSARSDAPRHGRDGSPPRARERLALLSRDDGMSTQRFSVCARGRAQTARLFVKRIVALASALNYGSSDAI